MRVVSHRDAQGRKAVAEITLIKGKNFKTVTESLA